MEENTVFITGKKETSLSEKILFPGVCKTEDVRKTVSRIEKKVIEARMYADMDEPEFWATSTISPKEAEARAKYLEEFWREIVIIFGDKLT